MGEGIQAIVWKMHVGEFSKFIRWEIIVCWWDFFSKYISVPPRLFGALEYLVTKNKEIHDEKNLSSFRLQHQLGRTKNLMWTMCTKYYSWQSLGWWDFLSFPYSLVTSETSWEMLDAAHWLTRLVRLLELFRGTSILG